MRLLCAVCHLLTDIEHAVELSLELEEPRGMGASDLLYADCYFSTPSFH